MSKHYLRSVRLALNVLQDQTYRPFVYEVSQLLKQKRSHDEFIRIAGKIYNTYQHDPRCISVMIDIQRRMDMLCGYMKLKGVPRTNNLIESMNSHLEGRLKTIKGFQSFHSANTWLNAYFIYRRVRRFTDCEGKFKHLNGSAPLQKTMKNPEDFDQIFSLFR